MSAVSSTHVLAAVGGAAATALLCGRGGLSGRAPTPGAPAGAEGSFDPVCEAACQGLDVIPAAEGAGAGSIETLGDMDVYVVGSGERAIVLIYDIFGFSPANTRHNCDVLAQAGFLVIMPDLFRGSGRRSPGFVRPQNDAVDTEILDTVVPFAKSKGAKTIGILGFCFGGGAAMRLASADVFAAAAGVHASGMASPDGETLVSKALCPIMLLQAGGDPSLTPVHETVQKMKSIKDGSVLRTFWDQRHGWCGATGNRTGDPRLKAAVASALTSIIGFFSRMLVVPTPQYTLHLYDHCPFCVKVELALGFLGMDYGRRVWGYGEGAKPVGDFEGSSVAGPAALKNAGEAEGTKALPILELPTKRQLAKDWKSASPYLRESSDIIEHVNQLSGMKLRPKTGAGAHPSVFAIPSAATRGCIYHGSGNGLTEQPFACGLLSGRHGLEEECQRVGAVDYSVQVPGSAQHLR